MLINRANLELAALASTDATRFVLNGLHLSQECTVATDGHVLGIVELPHDLPEADFPDVGVAPLTDPLAPFGTCTLTQATASALKAAIPRKHRLPILTNALVDIAGSSNGSFRAVAATDLEVTQPIEGDKIAGEYVAWANVLPTGKVVSTFHFNAALLRRILDVALKCQAKDGRAKSSTLKLEIFDDQHGLGPMKLTGTTEAGQAMTFLLMPVRP